MRKARLTILAKVTQPSSGSAGIQTQVVKLQSMCLNQGSLQLGGGAPELGLKDNLEFAKEGGVVGKGVLSQLGSASAEGSRLPRKGGARATWLPGLSEVPFGFRGSDFPGSELLVTLPQALLLP